MKLSLKDRFKIRRINKRLYKEYNVRMVDIRNSALEAFKNITRGNSELSDCEAFIKLNRDFRVGSMVERRNGNTIIVAYGYLLIYYDVFINTIVRVENYNRYNYIYEGKINKSHKEYYDKIFELK